MKRTSCFWMMLLTTRKAIQSQILAKVNRIEPAVRASLIATVAMTVIVIGYHGWFAARSLF